MRNSKTPFISGPDEGFIQKSPRQINPKGKIKPGSRDDAGKHSVDIRKPSTQGHMTLQRKRMKSKRVARLRKELKLVVWTVFKGRVSNPRTKEVEVSLVRQDFWLNASSKEVCFE